MNVAIIGPPASGKTNLCYLMAAVWPPGTGHPPSSVTLDHLTVNTLGHDWNIWDFPGHSALTNDSKRMAETLSDHLRQMDCIVCVAPHRKMHVAHSMAAVAPDVPIISIISDDNCICFRTFAHTAPTYHMHSVSGKRLLRSALALIRSRQWPHLIRGLSI
jgi:hypothetical protein